ncbi:MAG: hypothetical protein AAF928_17690 [Myxococcota bacterium]
MRRLRRRRPGCRFVGVLVVYLGLAGSGLAGGGCATVDVCEDGEACLCRGAFACQRECDGPGCDYRCISFGACSFECEEGDCTADCDGEGACTLDCPGGGCALTCRGRGACSLVCPNLDCDLTCDGNEGVCEQVAENPDPNAR